MISLGIEIGTWEYCRGGYNHLHTGVYTFFMREGVFIYLCIKNLLIKERNRNIIAEHNEKNLDKLRLKYNMSNF